MLSNARTRSAPSLTRALGLAQLLTAGGGSAASIERHGCRGLSGDAGAPYKRFSDSVRKLLSALLRSGEDKPLFPDQARPQQRLAASDAPAEGTGDALDQLLQVCPLRRFDSVGPLWWKF